MKAITPVISLIMLMLITVGIVGVSYAWFSGLATSSMQKAISIPPGGAYCLNGEIKTYILNNGDTAITTQDILVAQVDGVDVKGTPFFGDMSSGLVGWWKFDEAGGITAADSSGQGNDGTLVNNPQRVTGKSNNALQFNGVNNYVFVANDPSIDLSQMSAFSVVTWIKFNALSSGEQDPISQQCGSSSGWSYYTDSGSPTWKFTAYDSVAGGFSTLTLSTGISTNTWYHSVATWDGANLNGYLNGVAAAAPVAMTGAVKPCSNTLTFGMFADKVSNRFNGVLDEIKIYNTISGNVNIQPEKSGLIINYPGTEGRHTVRIGTASNAAETTISCG